MSASHRPTVIRAQPADVPRVATFLRDAWKDAGPGAPGWSGASEVTIREISSTSFLDALVAKSRTSLFLCEHGGRVVGMCVLRPRDETVAEIAGILVLQGEVGRGIGSLLLAEGLDWARGQGFRRALVKTESDNERALAIYRARGFTEQERAVEEVQGAPVSLTVLAADLGSPPPNSAE